MAMRPSSGKGGITYKTINQTQAVEAIQEYNNDYYSAAGKEKEKNVELDQRGYDLFGKCSIAKFIIFEKCLERFLFFIAHDYGGIQGEPIKRKLLICKKIRDKIINSGICFNLKIINNLPLKWRVPSEKNVNFLMSCFSIDSEDIYESSEISHSKRKFYVMGSKFLHFMRPDVFAPMDSNSRKFFFGTKDQKYNSPSGYMEMPRILNQILRGKWESIDLKKLRDVDGEHYHGDIKMIDKIAYTLGKK